jgi:energy-coupling factor transport system substrate-specific component
VTALLSQLGMEGVLAFQGAGGTALPFVFCGFATALIVGSMARTGHLATTLDLVLAIVAVTLANAVIGSLTATFVFGGITLHSSDFLMTGLLMGGQQLLEAAFWARIPLNLIDKGIAVGVAFLVLGLVKRPVQKLW